VAVPIAGWISGDVLEQMRRRKSGHPDGANTSLGMVLAESVVGAFEGVLSYFANTVSFIRLAAYAMSHAALLLAAFLMAAELRHAGPIGAVLGVGIIILGNLVALVLEGIIVSVQALRLEYYEFFGKFFSGAGEPFKPFQFAEASPVGRGVTALASG
jgi:V/A-type H+-transporting ATPase subunit I